MKEKYEEIIILFSNFNYLYHYSDSVVNNLVIYIYLSDL
jgi:hypothetical protein